ncbi:MAG: lysozyme [Oceanicaulis sp. HLUCCA04]|nr:MAG: lysozyme [Oceanicaulis sp. HLUCCA04]
MKPRLKSSRAARELIKTHEPFLGEAARRGRRWALGYGHTAAAREGARISREDAELLMLYDVIQAEQAIGKAVGEDIPGPVRDALVSFACSIGPGAFQVSDVARLARDSRHLEAAAALETWVRAEEDGRLVVSERLVRRRAAEKALYLQGVQERAEPAPEPVTAPRAEEAAEAAPRIGPLVDLELEFVDPPEPGGMVFDTDMAGEGPEAEPAHQAEPEAEPEPEHELEAAAEPETQIEPAEAQAEPGAEEAEDPTGSVIARMNAQMAETLAETDEREAEPANTDEPVRRDARLGFSYMTRGETEEPAPVPEPQAEAQAAPLSAKPSFKVGPVPVYAAISSVTVSRAEISVTEPAPAPEPEPVADEVSSGRAQAPAAAAGFSGEIQAVGRPADMPEDDEPADSDDIHPGVLVGSAAPAPQLPEPGPAPASGASPAAKGRWLFVANLAIGAAMTGFGLWTIIERGSNPEIVDFGLLGPVAAAMGIALTVTSAWVLITGKKSAKPAAEKTDPLPPSAP